MTGAHTRLSFTDERASSTVGKIVFAGVGNTLAGDDGVGIHMVRELKRLLPADDRVLFSELEGDLYEIWDMLPGTDVFVFLDAVTGDSPGMIRVGKTLPRAYTPSFHQSDLSAVVTSLQKLWDGEFPRWTLWGISIDLPEELGEGLSEPVRTAAHEAVETMVELLIGKGLNVDGAVIRIPCTD